MHGFSQAPGLGTRTDVDRVRPQLPHMLCPWYVAFPVCVWLPAPPFPSQEGEVSCPSALAYARRCRHTWSQARATLLKSVTSYATWANHQWMPDPLTVLARRCGCQPRTCRCGWNRVSWHLGSSAGSQSRGSSAQPRSGSSCQRL